MRSAIAAGVLVLAVAAAYLIPNVPYHRQITPFACGDASSEMVCCELFLNLFS